MTTWFGKLFGKLLAFSMFALVISGLFFADDARAAADCSGEFNEWQDTVANQQWACDCYICLWCSGATGKTEQARLAYENCHLL